MDFGPNFTERIPTEFEFAREEYIKRYETVQAALRETDLSCLLVSRPVDMRWMSAYRTVAHPFEILVVPNDKLTTVKPFFVTRQCENANAENLPWVTDLEPYSDTQDPVAHFCQCLARRGFGLKNCKKIGVQLEFLSARWNMMLQEHLQDIQTVDVSRFVEQLRLIRSDAELDIYRKSAELTERGTLAGLRALQVGVSENEIVAAVTNVTLAGNDGCRWSSYPPFCALGPYSSRTHRTFEGHRCIGRTVWADGSAEEGQLLFLEVGASFRAYHTSMMRTAWVGHTIPPWLREAEKLIQEAMQYIIDNLKPGNLPSDLDAGAREIFSKATFPYTQTTRSGYTIGAGTSPEWSDCDFSLVATNKRPLAANQVFHVIPFIQTPWGAIGLSETVVVTPEGGECLTGKYLPRVITQVVPIVEIPKFEGALPSEDTISVVLKPACLPEEPMSPA